MSDDRFDEKIQYCKWILTWCYKIVNFHWNDAASSIKVGSATPTRTPTRAPVVRNPRPPIPSPVPGRPPVHGIFLFINDSKTERVSSIDPKLALNFLVNKKIF